jgi:4-amino-4-deoxy-L-arabinose transferase-like glycosyltransferase
VNVPSRVGAHRSRWPLVLAAIFLLALVPRALVAWQLDDPPALTNDAGWYDFFGQQIADGHGYSLPDGAVTSRWPPGYPVFLGGIYKATSGSRGAARLAQAVLGAATAVLAAALARRLLSQEVGVVTGTIVALLPSHVLYSSALMSEVLFTFLLLAAFMLGTQNRSRWSAACAGVTFGAATLVRAQGLVLVLALFASWWALGYWRAPNRRASALLAAVLLGALAFTLMPWTVRNAMRMDTAAPVATNLGLNLWIGNNPDATGTVMDAPVAAFDAEVSALPNPQREVRFDALARNAALRYIAHHPAETIGRAPVKIFETYRNDRSFASWYEPPGTRYLSDRARQRIGRASDAGYLLLLVAAAAGLSMLLRARSPAAALPMGGLLLWTLVSVVFFGDSRYHLPLVPLLAIPAAYALVRGYDAAFTRRSVTAVERKRGVASRSASSCSGGDGKRSSPRQHRK